MAARRRWCGQPVTVGSSPLGSWMSKAVHTGTGEELGPDGDLAAPIDLDPVPPDEVVA